MTYWVVAITYVAALRAEYEALAGPFPDFDAADFELARMPRPGNGDGVLAIYDDDRQTLSVPKEQP